MASLPRNLQSEPAKVEQIITEFFVKSLQIIRESRSPYVSSRNYSGEQTASSPSSSSSSSSVRPRDKWFNLALRECPTYLENWDFCRHGNVEPMIIDVVLVQRTPAHPFPVAKSGPMRNPSLKDQLMGDWNTGQEELISETKCGKIVERWVVQYESRKSSGVLRDMSSGSKKVGGHSSLHSSETPTLFYRKMYKRSIILLRSLYVTVRLLPTYKLVRDLSSSGQIHPYCLTYKVSSFVEPFTRIEEAEMQHYTFAPVDTYCGRLYLSVMYRPALLDVNLESSILIPTQFISDYVGSPTTDPLRRLPSLPLTQSPLSPSHAVFVRRHSWSNDLNRAVPSVCPSPSPTYSDFRAFAPNMNSHHLPPRGCVKMDTSPLSSPHRLGDTPRSSNESLEHKKNMSFDECWPSPPFSPSPSPSPPTYLAGSYLSTALLRSESAPVSIPSARLGRSPGLPSSVLPPSPSPKGTRAGYHMRSDSLKAQVSRSRVPVIHCSPSDTKWQPSQDLQAEGSQTSGAANEVLCVAKDELGNMFGAREPLSRSSSRKSLRDDFDDYDFTYPFAVDYDDMTTHPRNRCEFEGKKHGSESPDSRVLLSVKQSQDAAIGSLVRMLQNAAPLHQDSSYSARFPQVSRVDAWDKIMQTNQNLDLGMGTQQAAKPSTAIGASMLAVPKTTKDALEDLKSFREMKDSLIQRGAHQSVDHV